MDSILRGAYISFSLVAGDLAVDSEIRTLRPHIAKTAKAAKREAMLEAYGRRVALECLLCGLTDGPEDFDRAAQPFKVSVSVTLGDKDRIPSRVGVDDCFGSQFAKYPDRFTSINYGEYTHD